MAEPKTKPTGVSVDAFIDAVGHARRREEARVVLAMMQRVTGEAPEMWGPSIVGFGRYQYKYESGREGAWMLTGFAPRKAALTVYIMPGFSQYDDLMARLGKHRTGKSCLYINKLDDVDLAVLEELVRLSVDHMRAKYRSGT